VIITTILMLSRLMQEEAQEPSTYMQELTRYLSANMNSVLLGLPTEIKELIYFDALSHAANMVLALPLDSSVTRVSPAAVRLLTTDVQFLSSFVDTLQNPILKENLDELIQTVALMATDNPEEFFDVGQANRKYGRVDRANGAILLEKVREGAAAAVASPTMGQQVQSQTEKMFGNYASRFGLNRS
jgi:hypothetical protein